MGRDNKGEIRLAAVKRIKATLQPLVAEAQAMLLGIQLAQTQNWQRLVCESDCLQLISMIRTGNILEHRAGVAIEDIIELSSQDMVVEWNHVRRDANLAAHTIAAESPSVEDDLRIWINECPSILIDIISKDNSRLISR